jgi:hypothetical protein
MTPECGHALILPAGIASLVTDHEKDNRQPVENLLHWSLSNRIARCIERGVEAMCLAPAWGGDAIPPTCTSLEPRPAEGEQRIAMVPIDEGPS